MAVATVRLQAWFDPTGPGFDVKFDPAGITAQATDSGCFIEFQLEVTPNWQGHSFACLLAVHGTLMLDATSGIEVPMQSLLPNYRSLRVPVSWADLARVEARRRGATQIVGRLSLAGLANIAFTPDHGREGPNQAVVTAAVHDNGGTPFTVEREHWLRLLKSAGFERVRLVELPVASGAGGEKWAECMRLLERATGELRSGQSEIAVGTCREVVEGVTTVFAQQWGVQVTRDKMRERLKELEGRMGSAWPDDKSAGEMLAGLYSAVWSWTSGEHHYGSRISRHDEAEFAIGLTAALLTHAGHLLQAHPEPLKAST